MSLKDSSCFPLTIPQNTLTVSSVKGSWITWPLRSILALNLWSYVHLPLGSPLFQSLQYRPFSSPRLISLLVPIVFCFLWQIALTTVFPIPQIFNPFLPTDDLPAAYEYTQVSPALKIFSLDTIILSWAIIPSFFPSFPGQTPRKDVFSLHCLVFLSFTSWILAI